MPIKMLSPDQIKKLEEINDPLVKKRYTKFFQLPQDLRQTIFAPETGEKIRKTAEKNGLDEEQLQQLAHTTGLILLAELKIFDFTKTIQERCGLEEATAREIAKEINQTIFLPHRESLKKIHQIAQWPDSEPKMPRMPMPPTSPMPPTTPEPRLDGHIVDLKG